MKVVKEGQTTRQFSGVNVGDCFGHSGNVYIRMTTVAQGSTVGSVNCVRLNDGRPGYFEPSTSVVIYPDAQVSTG